MCAPGVIASLKADIEELQFDAWKERAKLLRYISQLYRLLEDYEKSTEFFRYAQLEGYYGCVAFALDKAVDTRDPNDILLAIHMATGLSKAHVLSDYARALLDSSV